MKTDSNVQQSSYAFNGEMVATGSARQPTQQVAKAAPRRNVRRAAAAPPRGPQVPQPPQSVNNEVERKDDGVTKVRLQGVGIKTNYTLKEVLTITSDALQKPFTAFLEYMGNAGSLLIDGKPATQEQKNATRNVTDKFDVAASIVPGAGNIQTAGKILHQINDAANGQMPSRDEVAGNLTDGVSMIDVVIPGFKGKTPSRPGDMESPPGGMKSPPQGDVQTQPKTVQKAAAPDGQETSISVQKQLVKQGPLSLMPAASRQEDQRRIDRFSSPVSFYRKDWEVPNPDFPSVIHATGYKERRDVLTVGKGRDLTSYDSRMKASLNRDRSADVSPELADANVIQLGSGINGVAAINVCFADLAPGSTTIVTGGPMRGSTMLFTADETGFSAYHAQALKKTGAKSSDAAAASIASAHARFGGPISGHPPESTPPENGYDALFRAATSHPFSALIYSHDDASGDQPHPKYGPSFDAGAGSDRKLWSSMNFNYLAPDRNSREVGTAEAIIVKDMNGKVTVRVVAERGKVEDPRRDGTSNSPSSSFKYRQIESAVGTYTVANAA